MPVLKIINKSFRLNGVLCLSIKTPNDIKVIDYTADDVNELPNR